MFVALNGVTLDLLFDMIVIFIFDPSVQAQPCPGPPAATGAAAAELPDSINGRRDFLRVRVRDIDFQGVPDSESTLSVPAHQVLETRPAGAISIVDADVETDIVEPADIGDDVCLSIVTCDHFE